MPAPVASNMLHSYYQDRAYKQHRERVQNAKPICDSTAPKQHPHVLFKLNGIQAEEEKHARIDKQNKLLLKRMTMIMQSRGQLDNWNEAEASTSPNFEVRRRQHYRTAKENVTIAKRLESVRPSYPTKEMEEEYKKQERHRLRLNKDHQRTPREKEKGKEKEKEKEKKKTKKDDYDDDFESDGEGSQHRDQEQNDKGSKDPDHKDKGHRDHDHKDKDQGRSRRDRDTSQEKLPTIEKDRQKRSRRDESDDREWRTESSTDRSDRRTDRRTDRLPHIYNDKGLIEHSYDMYWGEFYDPDRNKAKRGRPQGRRDGGGGDGDDEGKAGKGKSKQGDKSTRESEDFQEGEKGRDAIQRGGQDSHADPKGGKDADAGQKGRKDKDSGQKGGKDGDTSRKGGKDEDAGQKGGKSKDAGHKGGKDGEAGGKDGKSGEAGQKGGKGDDAGQKDKKQDGKGGDKGKKSDPDDDCTKLHDAMDGLGTNEDVIIDILCQRDSSQRQQIKKKYQEKYKKDLTSELKSELSGNFEEVIIGLMMTSHEYDAHCLHEAMAGLGTTESTLIGMLCTRSGKELEKIKGTYKKAYKSDLEADIKGDTSGSFQALMLELCKGERPQGSKVDKKAAESDAKKLAKDGKAKLDPNDETFKTLMTKTNSAQAKATFEEYKKLTGRTIQEAIKKDMSGDTEDGYIGLTKAMDDPVVYYAQRLQECAKGMGTNDSELVRIIVSRSEIDLPAIKAKYKELSKKTLRQMIESETSGDYRKALLSLAKEK